MDFTKITKAHIEQALVRLRAGEVPADFLPSTDYDVVVGDERFPPKQVIAIAYHEATGITPAPLEFKGGKKGRAFNKLEEHGFVIEPKPASTSVWLFQGNPDKFDVDGYLASRTEFCWTVNQYRKLIKAGDRVYIWRSGKDAGIVAVAQAISKVALLPDDAREFWRGVSDESSGPAQRVKLKLLLNLVDAPLPRARLREELPGFSFIKSPQGTNFAVTSAENQVIESLLGIESLQIASDLEVQPRDVTSLTASDREALEVARSKSGAEGARKLYTHYKRERDTSLGKAAKKAFRAKNGKLCCEACGFEPEPIFGFEIIEAHHRLPLSQSPEGRLTTPEDFILLCPSCHRAIHKIADCDFGRLRALVGSRRL
jgi:hypothetical protein